MTDAGLTFVTGGCRSGKSTLALRLATAAAAATGRGVTFVATALDDGGDTEWTDRLDRHRAERPPGWSTIEEPLDLRGALAAAGGDVVVVDCLTLWTGAAVEHLADDMDGVVALATAHAALAARRAAPTIVVSNEVGSGIVPADEAVRRWRDTLGAVNRTWSLAADRAVLVVAGRALELPGPA